MLAILSRIWIPLLSGLIINILIGSRCLKKTPLKALKKIFTAMRASATGFILSALSFRSSANNSCAQKEGSINSNNLGNARIHSWSGAVGLLITISYVGFENALMLFGLSFLLSIIIGVIFSLLEKIKWLVKTKETISPEYLKENNYPEFEKYLSKKSSINEAIYSSAGLIKNIVIAMLVASFFQLFAPAEFIEKFSAPHSCMYAIPLATLIEIIGEGFSVFAGELYLLGANLGAVFVIISQELSLT